MIRLIIVLVILLLIFGSYGYTQTRYPCTITEIVDGDTVHCKAENELLNVRLIGIDAPESSLNPKTKQDAERTGEDVKAIMKLGQKAKKFVENRVAIGTNVNLEFDAQEQDRYGRVLAYVYLPNGTMLNEIIVQEGYAQVMTIPPNVKYQELFLKAQNKARKNERGLWGTNQP